MWMSYKVAIRISEFVYDLENEPLRRCLHPPFFPRTGYLETTCLVRFVHQLVPPPPTTESEFELYQQKNEDVQLISLQVPSISTTLG